MRRIKCLRLSLLLLFFSSLYAQSVSVDVPQADFSKMNNAQETILNSLANLKKDSQYLTQELKNAQEEAKISQTKLTSLQNSLDATLNSYMTCAEKLNTTEMELMKKEKQLNKLTALVVAVISLFIFTRVALIILRFKNIKIPYIINTIL